ncbi:hypothetical protein N2152v2_000595 [Parachlorella kessleri]
MLPWLVVGEGRPASSKVEISRPSMGGQFIGVSTPLEEKAGFSPTPESSPSNSTPTSENTFYRGSVVLSAQDKVDSAADCQGGCADDPVCEFWSYCPKNATDGCDALYFTGVRYDASLDPVNPGFCVLSRSTKRGEKDYMLREGKDVLWSGGMFVCPLHEAPTNWTLTSSHDVVAFPMAINEAGGPAQCYSIKKDDFVDSPPSYVVYEGTTPSPAFAKQLCDGTRVRGKDVDASVAQAKFFSAIQVGEQEAIDAVTALIYVDTELTCWDSQTIFQVLQPPDDKISADSFYDQITNLLVYTTNLANAAENAGLGLCAVIYTMKDGDDTSKELVTIVHTGDHRQEGVN